MACFYPMQAIRLSSITSKGKNPLKFVSKETANKLKSHMRLVEGLPCGQCTGCRLERSRQWAVRIMHESQLHTQNCFITLTFTEEALQARENPKSLDKREFQLFMKRLRKHFKDSKLRYYMCGEYGETLKRPHYHAIIFNLDFSDKQLFKIQDGKRYYTSQILSKLWPYGFNVITDVNFDTAAYVARYIMKKHLGKNAWKNYYEYSDENGELIGHRIPEYTTMSRRSGIGKDWLDKYLRDVYPHDRVFVKGKGYFKPPKYYDTLYEVIDPVDHSRIKEQRITTALSKAADNTIDRLIAKAKVKLSQIKNLKRTLE